MTRRAARTDRNQSEIVATLRKCGARVAITSGLGAGHPDILIRYAGRWQPIEIKDGNQPPSARHLTPDEMRWWRDMGSEPWIVERVEDVGLLLARMAGRK